MDLPNINTLKIIEERKNYLVQKSQKRDSVNTYELREIKALERVINLIVLVQNLSKSPIEIDSEESA